jgi:hypothetical protein
VLPAQAEDGWSKRTAHSETVPAKCWRPKSKSNRSRLRTFKIQSVKTRIQFGDFRRKCRTRRDNRLTTRCTRTAPKRRGRPESKSNRSKLCAHANATATHEVVMPPARSKNLFDVGTIGADSRWCNVGREAAMTFVQNAHLRFGHIDREQVLVFSESQSCPPATKFGIFPKTMYQSSGCTHAPCKYLPKRYEQTAPINLSHSQHG